MSKRRLEMILEAIRGPPSPNIRYEQYLTPTEIVSEILWIASARFDDIENRLVVDLGCGTGRFCIGAALLGASWSVGVDIDSSSLKLARRFCQENGVLKTDFLNVDARRFHTSRKLDTLFQNPPFGVHRKGADTVFLKKAFNLCNVVYSIHKAETAEYIRALAKEYGKESAVLFEDFISIPPIYKFHYKKKHGVKIRAFRIE